jgi:hypothetical protein
LGRGPPERQAIERHIEFDRRSWFLKSTSGVLPTCKYGADAELEAAKRADLMLERGDDDGVVLWMRIRSAIKELQAPPSARLN